MHGWLWRRPTTAFMQPSRRVTQHVQGLLCAGATEQAAVFALDATLLTSHPLPTALACRAAAWLRWARRGARASTCSAYTHWAAAWPAGKRCVMQQTVCRHHAANGCLACMSWCAAAFPAAWLHNSCALQLRCNCPPLQPLASDVAAAAACPPLLQVMESWKMILGSGRLRIKLEDVRVYASDR